MLKSDYVRIEILHVSTLKELCVIMLKSDYDRIEIREANYLPMRWRCVKIRL